MKKITSIFISFFYLLVITPALSANVGLGVFLQEQVYFQEDSVNFYLSGYNQDSNSKTVDVHVVVIAADNTVYEYPNF